MSNALRLVSNALRNGEWFAISEKREIRYNETAYLIWALDDKLGCRPLLEANIDKWDNGTDDGSGSNFRNFEFEAHVALRFVEEGLDVQLITGPGKAEMVVEDKFVVECKRPTRLSGVFFGSLKARKQIGATGKPGYVVLNLDDLQDFTLDSSDHEALQTSFERLAVVAEHGFGSLDSDILGAVLEYLPGERAESQHGSYLQAVSNCSGKHFLETLPELQTLSAGLTGDLSLTLDVVRDQVLPVDRYQADYDRHNKPPMVAHFNNSITR